MQRPNDVCGHLDKRHYAMGLCRQCYRVQPWFLEKRKVYYQQNKHLYRAQSERVRVEKRRQSKAYGISKAEWDALYEAQNSVCAICSKPPGKRSLSVDHCHATGKIRGLLCNSCNGALGHLGDSIELMTKAIEYLKCHQS